MSPKLQKEFFTVDFVGVEAKVQPINHADLTLSDPRRAHLVGLVCV